MQPLTLQEVIDSIGGRPLGRLTPIRVTAVGTDSRRVQAGEVFFALRGERYDGHAYVADALAAGAVAAVVSDPALLPPELRVSGAVIAVADTTAALGQLARYYRGQLAATVVAVAGSNGKTTTKEMIHAVLSTRFRGSAAPRSFNNHVGVPLTLLAADAGDEYVVVEIGTNAPGEVASLARIVRPDVAVITSLGQEHLEFFGDLAGVADEETSLLDHVGPGGLAVLPVEAAACAARRGAPRLTRVTFGTAEPADLRATQIIVSPEGVTFRLNDRFAYALPVLGAHNALNALAAIAVGKRLGLDDDRIAAGLRGFRPPPMRLERLAVGPLTVINDAYNANPTSMAAAIATLDAWSGPGRRVLVLGEMCELGRHARRAHAELGRSAGRSTAQVIVAVGRYARGLIQAARTVAEGKRLAAFARLEEAARALPRLVQPGDVLLLKGSRAAGMERLLESLARVRAGAGPRRRPSRPTSRPQVAARRPRPAKRATRE